jgi:hypothetical protein
MLNNNNDEFILLIMNCEKYKWKAKFQKNTWLKNLSSFITYYHVLGDPNLETEYLFDNESKLLYVKTEDDYNSLPKKVIAAYQGIYQTFPNLKYIFKTDDDQILIKPAFFEIIKNIIITKKKQDKVHYGGFPVNILNPQLSSYYLIHPELPQNIVLQKTVYCNGRFYLLSKEAIENLITKRKEIEKEFFEDYAIGYNLDPSFKETLLPIKSKLYFQDQDIS